MLTTQARAGLPGEARAGLAALDDEEARSGEVRNADAVICLAEGEPAAALGAVASAGSATSARRTWPPNRHSVSPSKTGWCCRS
jgi:LuxR family transcriptional regulator, maltose regulon positive regulatory protein